MTQSQSLEQIGADDGAELVEAGASAGSAASSGESLGEGAAGLTGRAATLVLSRHGQTVWHAENRYAGSSDVDLTGVGHDQAGALARWAKANRPAAFYSSPIRRAVETTWPVTAETGLVPVIDDDLREAHFGIAEGLTIAEMRTHHPEAAAQFELNPVAGSFPEAELPTDAARRGVAALQRIAAAHPGQMVLVVAHNTLIRLVLCSALGMPLANYRKSLPRLDNGTLTRISLTGSTADPVALLSFNVPLETTVP